MSAALLDVKGLGKRYGGLIAVDCVSMTVGKGSITGLIGPNGAGKTTLFSLVSGFVEVDSGQVLFEGRDITGLPAHERSRIGIARTFQIVQPFAGLSVLENISVGAYLRHSKRHAALERAEDVANRVGLGGMLESPAHALTIAGRKRLELARALATEPKLLLLDEVLAGLNPSEINDMIPILQKIMAGGISILFVEHVMQAVMRLCDTLYVLAQGRLIAEGKPDKVAKDKQVIEAYLGHGAASRIQMQTEMRHA